MYAPEMILTRRTLFRILAALLPAILLFGSCQTRTGNKSLTLAINSGVEGDALRQAAKDYEAQTGVHIDIAEFPYANLFEKELIDLNSRTGAYDLIMLDDPWFPKFASLEVLTDLTPLLQKRGLQKPDDDFVGTSVALCRHPYQTGTLLALPYVGNSQLFFYRKDLFQKHDLPEPATWDDVLAAAKTISENGNQRRAGWWKSLRLRHARGSGQRRGG
jgi:multiple sugar transport system substrate-binding protein